MDLVNINLRGTIFTTKKTILDTFPNSRLSNLNENSACYIQTRDEYFFDRNPSIFHHVLDYFSTGELHIPSYVCAEKVRKELKYWGIPFSVVGKCCWKHFYQSREDMSTLKILEENDRNAADKAMEEENLKIRIWKFLSVPTSTRKSKVWFGFLNFIIISSVIIYIIETSRSFRVDKETTFLAEDDVMPSETVQYYLNTTVLPGVLYVDATTNAILTLEWIVRFSVCPCKLVFFKGILNITEIVASFTFWYGFCMEMMTHSSSRVVYSFKGYNQLFIFIALIYATRIFRVFRIIQHNRGMKILLLSLRSSARELCLLAISFLSFSLMFGVMIFTVEIINGTANLTDVFTCTWWSIITMTTVGYGDVYPTTEIGYIIAIICAIVGILLVALPVAVTSSNFNDFYTFDKYRIQFREEQSVDTVSEKGPRHSMSITNENLKFE